jgi:hypothetical protein
MSEDEQTKPEREADEPVPTDAKEDDAMRALLKRSTDAEVEGARPHLLRGVQKKIRTRSKGKFYADGWSTSQPRIHYALVAAAMLLVIAIAYFALGPMGITAR